MNEFVILIIKKLKHSYFISTFLMNLYFLQIFVEKRVFTIITLFKSVCVSVVMSKVAHTAAVEIAFEVRTKKKIDLPTKQTTIIHHSVFKNIKSCYGE